MDPNTTKYYRPYVVSNNGGCTYQIKKNEAEGTTWFTKADVDTLISAGFIFNSFECENGQFVRLEPNRDKFYDNWHIVWVPVN